MNGKIRGWKLVDYKILKEYSSLKALESKQALLYHLPPTIPTLNRPNYSLFFSHLSCQALRSGNSFSWSKLLAQQMGNLYYITSLYFIEPTDFLMVPFKRGVAFGDGTVFFRSFVVGQEYGTCKNRIFSGFLVNYPHWQYSQITPLAVLNFSLLSWTNRVSCPFPPA